MQFHKLTALLYKTFSLKTVQMDNDEHRVNIYKGMHVVFTQNRDKKNGIVNGQPAIVSMMQGFTVLLQLPNAKKVSVYTPGIFAREIALLKCPIFFATAR